MSAQAEGPHAVEGDVQVIEVGIRGQDQARLAPVQEVATLGHEDAADDPAVGRGHDRVEARRSAHHGRVGWPGARRQFHQRVGA